MLTKDGAPALTLQGGRLHKGALVTRAPEITSKEAADALRGLELYAPREAFAAPEDEDEFYLADLIGLDVRRVDGVALGGSARCTTSAPATCSRSRRRRAPATTCPSPAPPCPRCASLRA